MNSDPLAIAGRLSSTLFLPVRKLAGPLHRRRRSFKRPLDERLPPLPEGWDDERWYRGGFPPRRRTVLQPRIHGDEYFADLYGELLSARERVTICGWCLTPLMPLLRDEREKESMLADVLREVSSRADVFVLLWAGAQALFEPTERMTADARRTLLRIAPRVRCELDDRASFSHDHHQKAVTIDGRVAYVGGMDISTFQGDRWDTREHPLRFGPNWHDVQMRLEGEVVGDVEENFCERWNSVTGEHLAPLQVQSADGSQGAPAQIVRTVPEGFYPFAPYGEYGIYHALATAIRGAKRFVYLENQYIWAPEIVDALAEAMNRPRQEPFRIVLVLPARAYTGRYDNDEHVRQLASMGAGRGIFHAYALYTGGPALGTTGFQYVPIYVHAKVAIVDDEWLSVGSANLNRRGLATDTEMNVHSIAPDVARALRIRLWSEHLALAEEEVASAEPETLVDEAWPAAAKHMEDCIRARGFPPRSKVRRYVPGRNAGSRIMDIIQGATLEH